VTIEEIIYSKHFVFRIAVYDIWSDYFLSFYNLLIAFYINIRFNIELSKNYFSSPNENHLLKTEPYSVNFCLFTTITYACVFIMYFFVCERESKRKRNFSPLTIRRIYSIFMIFMQYLIFAFVYRMREWVSYHSIYALLLSCSKSLSLTHSLCIAFLNFNFFSLSLRFCLIKNLYFLLCCRCFSFVRHNAYRVFVKICLFR
jgi:hypothetical protein